MGKATTGDTDMVRRGEITDQAWQEIEPLLPEYGQSGGQWRDHRTIINGILWKLRTGSPWRDLPERYGPWQTCYDRFNRWRRMAPGIAFWPMPRPRTTRSGI
jgi:transposase